MRGANVCNHGDIGFSGKRKRTDFIRTTRAHFDDGGFVAVLELEQRHGHADVVIEVTCGRMRIVLHRKHRLHHFLGGRLSVASRDGDLLHLEVFLVAFC